MNRDIRITALCFTLFSFQAYASDATPASDQTEQVICEKKAFEILLHQTNDIKNDLIECYKQNPDNHNACTEIRQKLAASLARLNVMVNNKSLNSNILT